MNTSMSHTTPAVSTNVEITVPAHLLAGDEQQMSVEDRIAWMQQRQDWIDALPLPDRMPACPDWCTREDGHKYESILDDLKTWSRFHSGPSADDVAVTQEELYVDGAVTYGKVVISNYNDDGIDELDSAAARRKAQALLAAADRLDSITGASA